MPAQPPEQPRGRGFEAAVGPGEHGPYVHRLIAAGERVQTAGSGQFVGQGGKRKAGVGGGPRGHDREDQR
jgi:hypothetical protein